MTHVSNIPEARRLYDLAIADFRRGVRTLNKIRPLLFRPSPVRRSKRKSVRLTAKLAEQIRVYARRHPTMSYDQIGRHHRVNGGRVSEAIRKLK